MTNLTNSGIPTGGLLLPLTPQPRFRVRLHRFGGLADWVALAREIISVTRPIFNVETSSVEGGGLRAGEITWDDLTMAVRDDVVKAASELVGRQIAVQLDDPTHRFDMIIDVFAPDQSVIETWNCRNCFLVTANFNAMDHSGREPQTIELTIKSDAITQSACA